MNDGWRDWLSHSIDQLLMQSSAVNMLMLRHVFLIKPVQPRWMVVFLMLAPSFSKGLIRSGVPRQQGHRFFN